MRWTLAVLFLTVACSACGGDSSPQVASTRTFVASPSAVVAKTAAPRTVPPPATAAPQAAAEPRGYPLDPDIHTDLVVGATGSRTIASGSGPGVRQTSELRHIAVDGAFANAAGWNCRVHQEYEGAPAVDWYVPAGTPVYATMDGTATLLINTHVNAFDYYGVDREPYIGDPDRARAPISPFPGPGGGMGVYVSVSGAEYRTDYGHLELDATIAHVPEGAFADGFSDGTDYRARYAAPRDFRVADQVASWPVRRGDVIGYTGDAGYSEAPHLHYQVRRLSDGALLCPTGEAGFPAGGWLTRP